MMPRPRSKTSVLAVPRSTARSRCPKGKDPSDATEPVGRPSQPVAVAQRRQRLACRHGVVRQRLERHEPLPQVVDPDGRHLRGQPRQPAHHRALVALAVLALDQQADRQRVVEVDPRQLGGRRADHRQPPDPQRALEPRVGASVARHMRTYVRMSGSGALGRRRTSHGGRGCGVGIGGPPQRGARDVRSAHRSARVSARSTSRALYRPPTSTLQTRGAPRRLIDATGTDPLPHPEPLT